MKIIPAIDIIDGKCVRLTQGNYQQIKVYREDPVDVALEFQEAGMEYLHLVDLDGAKKGKVMNWKVIERIQEKTALLVDFGGGVKTDEEVEQLLELGINQINVGSLAIKEPKKFIDWMHHHGTENFILSTDVKNENVMINGWQESVDFRLFNLIVEFINHGLTYLSCTDIGSDGMLQGPNIALYKKLKNHFTSLKIIASGGVSSMDDINALEYLNLHGVIIGKAIYEGRINLTELKNR